MRAKQALQTPASVERGLKKEPSEEAVRRLRMPVALHAGWRTPRLSLQQGVFTLHGGKIGDTHNNDTEPITLEELHKEHEKKEKPFLCHYLIPHQFKQTILHELETLGIHHSILHPELESQAKYMNKFWAEIDDAAK